MEACFCFQGREVYLGFYVGEVSTCSKTIDGGPIKLLFLDPKKKLCGCTHSLINRSMNKYPFSFRVRVKESLSMHPTQLISTDITIEVSLVGK
jgi:hypothetical protein